MRIYTEVIWQWDDKQNKLVEVSSKHEEYNGEVALCLKWGSYYNLGYDSAGNRYVVKGQKGYTGNDYEGYKIGIYQRTGYDSTGEPEYKAIDTWGLNLGIEDQSFEQVKRLAAQNVTDNSFDTLGSTGGWYDSSPSQSTITEGGEYGETDEGSLKELGVSKIKGFIGDWNRIVGGDSVYHREVKSALEDMQRAGEGVPGETYEDPVTGDELPVLGVLAQAEDDYTSALKHAETVREEAGESAEIGRGQTLQSARAGYSPAVRQAAAAAASTGFAGSGGGEAARKELAQQFMTDVAGVETGYGEAIESADLAEEQTIEAEEGIYQGAAAGFASAESSYKTAKVTAKSGAEGALRTLQNDMEDIISVTRTDIDNQDWSPFDDPAAGTDVFGQGDIYGWNDPSFTDTPITGLNLFGDSTGG